MAASVLEKTGEVCWLHSLEYSVWFPHGFHLLSPYTLAKRGLHPFLNDTDIYKHQHWGGAEFNTESERGRDWS